MATERSGERSDRSGAAAGEAASIALSVVVPVLDEAPTLGALHQRLRGTLGPEAELIFVDDGSGDGTPDLLRAIAARDPRARAVRLRRHRGKSEALSAGFARARGELIATIDADLQEDPADIARLRAELERSGLDLVGGWRRVRRDPPAKVRASRLFNSLVSWLGGTRFRDINCGLKVMRREVLEELQLSSGFHRFLPLLAHWKGFRVSEVEIVHRPREQGASRFGRERIFHGLVDLAVILFLVRSDRRPSRNFIAWGGILSLSGLAICAFLAALRLATGSIQSRFPLLALGIVLFLSGIQILSLGFFAELIAHLLRTGRPVEIAAEEL